MDREVIWTEAAFEDLESTADYIAEDSAYYAAGFILEVHEASNSLAYFPNRGHIVPEFNDSGIREIFIRNYRLIYHVSQDAVLILGFIHGARDREEPI